MCKLKRGRVIHPHTFIFYNTACIYQDIKRFVDMANQGHLVAHSMVNLTEEWRWYPLSSLNSISWCPPKAFQVYVVSQKDPHFRGWTCSGHYLMYKKLDTHEKACTQTGYINNGDTFCNFYQVDIVFIYYRTVFPALWNKDTKSPNNSIAVTFLSIV